jgi:succinylglutamate desuccinylase
MNKPIKEDKPVWDYQQQVTSNEEIFKQMLKKVRPDIFVLMDIIDQTHVNAWVLVKVAQNLYNIASGNKYGKVTCVIDNGTVTFVYGEDAHKINEPVLKPIKTP